MSDNSNPQGQKQRRNTGYQDRQGGIVGINVSIRIDDEEIYEGRISRTLLLIIGDEVPEKTHTDDGITCTNHSGVIEDTDQIIAIYTRMWERLADRWDLSGIPGRPDSHYLARNARLELAKAAEQAMVLERAREWIHLADAQVSIAWG